MLCMAGFLALRLSVSVTCPSVRLCVCEQNISKSIQPINFIFGASLPYDSGKNRLDFEKKCPGVRVGVGGSKFGPNDKR